MAIDNYRTISARLRDRASFRGNSLRGDWLTASAMPGRGRLTGFDAAAYRELGEWAERSGLPAYVVRSYATPIAFALPGLRAYIVGERFSATTTRGQNLCRAWIDDGLRATA